jgi:protoporphyrinogen oxidase
MDYDVLVNTVPLPTFIERIEDAPQTILEDIEHLHYRALVLVYLLYKEDLDIPDTWLYYPEENVSFTRVSVPDNFNPAKDLKGRTCFCVEFTCEVGDATWRADGKDLAEKAHGVFQQSGLVQTEYADTLAVHIREGYPVYTVGYEERLQRAREFLNQKKKILTTGRQGLFRHNNIDQSIQMGLLAAEEILKNQDDFEPWYRSAEQFNDYRIID